jgi:transcriptional regulator with XRE-family HTH domain
MIDDTSALLAARIAAERQARGLSLGDLAARSGVSKAMLSRIERQEASPTANVLARIAAAFGVTLAELLTHDRDEAQRVAAADQPVWTDPDTGYVRRQVFVSRTVPLELVEVMLPAGRAVAIPASAYGLARHVLWVLEGQVEIKDGDQVVELAAGDRFRFGPPADRVYRNSTDQPCRYLMALIRA